MNNHGVVCDDQLLQSMLQDELTEAAAETLLEHVESCESCQRRVDELAATSDEWKQAASVLAGTAHSPIDWPPATLSSDRPVAWTESMARQLLSPPSHPENLGRLGRYEIERLIGAGGMGVVFRAYDTELNRPVAIKVLAPHLACSGPARRRFEREARAAAAVVHHHVVPIHNVETEGELPFLVMHLVAGESLQARIDREGPLEVREILRIGMQVAAGLSAAHSQGLVHRDIKPSNILLESEGVERALITDFGLARAADDASLTRTGFHPGTPQYMSPEQARGYSVNQQSDLFSLGSLLYTLCAGRPPFRAETPLGIMRRISDDAPTPIREVNAEIPQWLANIVEKLMSKQKADRFETADEVHQLLEACLNHVQQPTAVELPDKLQKMAPKNPPARTGWSLAGMVATMSVGFLAVLLFGIVYFIQTNEGTVRVEVLDESLAVTIEGKTVTVKDGDKPPLTLRPGAHNLVVKQGDTELFTESFQLRRGDELVFKAELTEGRVVLTHSGDTIQSKAVGKAPPVIAMVPPTTNETDLGEPDTKTKAAQETDDTGETSDDPPTDTTAWKDEVKPLFETDRFIPTPFGQHGRIHALEYSPNGEQLLASGSFWGAALFNAKSGELIRKMPYDGMHVTADFSPDGNKIVLANRLAGETPVWNIEPGEFETSYPMCRWVARYSYNGNVLFSISAENLMTAFDTKTGKRLDLVIDDDRTFGPAMIAASPTGPLVAAVSAKGILRVWDHEADKLLAEKEGAALGVHNCKEIEFTPDGKSIVVLGGDSATELLDARTLKVKLRFETGFEKFKSMSLAVSGNGKVLAVGCECGYVVVFSLFDGRRMNVRKVRNDYVAAVALSPDTRSLACGFETQDGIFVLDIGDIYGREGYYHGIPLDVHFERPPLEAFLPGPREALENGARFQDRVSNLPFNNRSWVDPSDVIDPTQLVRKKAVEKQPEPDERKEDDDSRVKRLFSVPTPKDFDFKDADIRISDDQSLVLVGKNGEHLLMIDKERKTAQAEPISGWRGMQFIPGTRRIVTKTWDEVAWVNPDKPLLDSLTFRHKICEGDWIDPEVSPNGNILATRPKLDQVQFFDFEKYKSGEPIEAGGGVFRMYFTPDSKHFCVHAKGELSLWNPKTGKRVAGPFRDGPFIHGLMAKAAYDPVRSRIVTIENFGHDADTPMGSRVVVRPVSDDKTKTQTIEIPAHATSVFWADPKHLIVSGGRHKTPKELDGYRYGDYPMFLIRLDDGESELVELAKHIWYYPVLTPNGRYVIGASNSETLCWKVGDKEPVWRTPGRTKVIAATNEFVLLRGFGSTAEIRHVETGDVLKKWGDVVRIHVKDDRIWVFNEKAIEVYTLAGDMVSEKPLGAKPLGHGYSRLNGEVYFALQKIDQAGADDFERLKWELGRELPALETFASENRKESFLDNTGWVLKKIKLAADIDAESFVPLSNEYAKDKNRVYYRCSLRDKFWMVELPGADPESFEHVATDLAKDNFQVWQKATPNLKVDPRKVRVVGGGMWTDANKVWSTNSLYVQAYVKNPDSFEHVGGDYFRDAKYVYYRAANYAKPIDRADPTTFRTVGEKQVFAVDRDTVWLEGAPLNSIDAATFEVVHDYVCKDKTHVYVRGASINGAFTGRIHTVANLDDRGSVLLSDGETRFVYLADWVDVFQVSLASDDLEVRHEAWERTPDLQSKIGKYVSQLSTKGWKFNNLNTDDLHSHQERLVLETNTSQFVKAWEFMSGETKAVSAAVSGHVVDLPNSKRPINRLFWSNDGSRVATVTKEEEIRVFDATNGKLLSITDTRPTYLPIVRMNGDLSLAAIIDMGHHESSSGAVVHSIPTGEIIRLFDPGSSEFPREIEQAAFDPSGEKIAVADRAREKVTIWNVKTGELLKELSPTFDYGVNQLAWSKNGELLAVGSDGSGGEAARVGKVFVCPSFDESKESIHQSLRNGVYAHAPRDGDWLSIQGLAFSNDGKQIIATYAVEDYPLTPSEKRFAHAWNIETGESTATGTNCSYGSKSDSKLLANDRYYAMRTGSTLRILNRVTLKEVLRLRAPHDIKTFQFSPTNDRIAVATNNGGVRIYDLPKTNKAR